MRQITSLFGKKKFISLTAVIISLVLLGGGTYMVYKQQLYAKEEVPAAVDASELRRPGGNLPFLQQAQDGSKVSEAESQDGRLTAPAEQMPVPESLNLKITFYSQAPFGDWSLPWQEACEEASVLLIANQYFHHDWTREEFNQEILKIVEWEKERFGQYEHTDMEETRIMLEEYFGLKSVLHRDPGYDDVRAILARGNFIVMPFAGKKLANPFYTNGGPNYHALVAKGYKPDHKIITHDVGTRRGEDYVYSWERINNSLHDFAVPIEAGEKVIIEVIQP